MAMPRYKYAIGHAPVRFPSAAKDDVSNAPPPPHARPPNDLTATERPTRWSVMSLVRGGGSGGDLEPSTASVKKTRSQQDLRSASGGSQASSSTLRAAPPAADDAGIRRSTSTQTVGKQAERVRSTSLLEAPVVPSHARVKKGGDALRSSMALVRGDVDFAQHNSKRVSWIVPFDSSSSRSSSRTSSIRSGVEATEQTGLLARDMSQPRPASLRPSSLFWTEIGSSETAGSSGSKADTRRGSSASTRSYGATSPSQPAPAAVAANKDDPYGFRAMAGPVLLPLFHEQQRKATLAAAPPSLLGSATRSCASPWRWLSFVALLTLSAAVTYFFTWNVVLI